MNGHARIELDARLSRSHLTGSPAATSPALFSAGLLAARNNAAELVLTVSLERSSPR